MRRSRSEIRGAGFALVASAAAWIACSPPPEPAAVPAAPTVIAPREPDAAPAPSRRKGRTLLAEPRDAPLPFVLESLGGVEAPGRAVVAVAADAEDGVAWARRLDSAGAEGPLLRFPGQHLVGGFDRSDGSTTWVTSDGARLCFGASSVPAERSCVESSPSAIVPVGDRLALLEVTSRRPPDRGAGHAHPAAPAKDAKHREARGAARKARPGAKGAKKKKQGHAGPAHAPSHPLVELFVRWVEPSGSIAAEAAPTDLHFEAPLDGMTLADARARPPGVEVLWYETAPKRKTRSPLGSGRLMAASLRADGKLDFASRVAVVDADVEFGQLKDHHEPRLAGGAASTFLALDATGRCEALALRPALARLEPDPTTCAVAPDRIHAERPGDRAALASILADDPRRAFGQPKHDVGLVAWAGDRGYYLRGASLRSASLSDGAPRDEPHPFPAKRAPIGWGSFAADGEGVAFVDGALVRVAADGALARAPAAGRVAAPELHADRRRAARIGATWWIARGPRLRLTPEVLAGPAADAHPDTQALVGGAERGLSIEVASGALRVALVDAAGAATDAGAVVPSPVLPGFDACERASGGALVAGVSPKAPAEVVALAIDATGHAGPARAIPLPFLAGDLAVRLVPLPSGGALLMDLDRDHVVWLDDDARPVGAPTPWPTDASDVVCPYGRPLRLSAPAPTPEQFVALPDVAAGACIVGDAVWARDGSLRWFGGTMEGLDFYPELASFPLAAPAPAPAPAPVPAPAPAPAATPRARVCPSEMVSIAGRFCVDRFEAMIVDARTGAALSPDYPTTPNLLDVVLGEWSTGRERVGTVHARAFPLPWIPIERFGAKPAPLAVSRLGVRPSGYLTGLVAAAACEAAGKRLCTLDEFVTACRGEADTPFPYGDAYEDGTCNVFREEHPAALLHGNASIGHLDPRLDRVRSHGEPLLRRTGESRACRSEWGDDAVYDMVGNLDEWVDEGGGAFAGGFYSRSTRSGCEAVVTNHPKSYLDYSTGARCCRAPL